MNSRTLSILAVVGFLLLGGLCLGLRYRALRQAETAREDSLWDLTYVTRFEAVITPPGQEEARVTFGMPFDTRHCRVAKRTWIVTNPNLHANVRGPYALTGNRLLELSTRQAGTERYEATANFELHLSPRRDRGSHPELENLTLDAYQRYTRPDENIPVADPDVREKAQLVPDEAETDWERLQWIFKYCSDIDSSGEAPPDDVKIALATGRGTPRARARTMVTLCRVLRIPSRLVTGFRVRQGANLQPQIWVEVFQNQAWVPFDPTDGWSLNLPMDYVPVRRGADEVHDATNVSGLSALYTIRRLDLDSRILRAEMRHPLQILSLKRLPVPMHKVMSILLLLPFGALITAFIRNVVGIQTFGTFAPALLAMSFIYTDLKTGLMILVVVITIGLLGRSLLERLRLLMVPRLSIILTMVIICVVFGLSILHYMFPRISAEAVLLPMVILTILIERFHVTIDEDGLVYALQLAIGTVVVAILCYAVLGWDEVGAFVLTYPESHFFTIAAFIALGRYAGYRLTELWRFRDLVEPSEPVR